MRRQTRTSRVRKQRNKLVYRRTEVGGEDKGSGNGIFYFLSIFLLGGVFYIVFLSGIFSVKDINVKGTKELNSEEIKGEIEEALREQLFKNNLLFFNKKTIARAIKKEFSPKEIKIKKIYINKVEVQIEEYTPSLQWFSSGKFYTLDEKGRVVGVEPVNKDSIPVVCDNKNLKVKMGERLVTEQFIKFIKYLYDNFQFDKSGKISKVEINESLNEIVVTSTKGFKVYFDTTRDAEKELKNLSLVLKNEKVRDRYIRYIDLRVKNKVFFR